MWNMRAVVVPLVIGTLRLGFSVSGKKSPYFEYFFQNSYSQVTKERLARFLSYFTEHI